jgi:hypothetical protein
MHQHPLHLNLLAEARIRELHEEAARRGRAHSGPHADDGSFGRRGRRALGGALIRLGERLRGDHRRPGLVGDGARPAA